MARRIVADLDYEQPKPGHSASGFRYDQDYLRYVRKHNTSLRWDCASIYFWYRQSPEILSPIRQSSLSADFNDPPQSLDGMVNIRLDPKVDY